MNFQDVIFQNHSWKYEPSQVNAHLYKNVWIVSKLTVCVSPFVFLPDVVFLRKVDEIYNRFRSDEEMFIKNLYLFVVPFTKPDWLTLRIQ